MKAFTAPATKRKKKEKPEKHRKHDEGELQKPKKKQRKSWNGFQDAENEIQANRDGKEKKKQRTTTTTKVGVNILNDEKKEKKEKRKDVITDERFAAVHYDPRFQRMPKKEAKVVVDSRFSSLFTDEDFAGSSAPVDKRGRKKKKGVNPLLHYYLRDEEEEEPKVAVDEEASEGKIELDNSESEDDESSSAYDEDEDDEDEVSVDSEVCYYLLANHEDTPRIKNGTHRLAIANMDWDHIKAVDLYVVMSSCLPKGGQILSVSIYPSEFGLKCMETEAVRGPFSLIYTKEDESEDEAEIDNQRLRIYELNRLRYYYAVVVCDSSATANQLYETLDGTELLKTSNVLDLRFIPDEMEFKHPPRDITTEAPVIYREPDFQTRALQHSKVKLSWEEDPQRKKLLRRKFDPNRLDDFEEYLASTDEGSDDENDDENDFGENGEAEALAKGKGKKLLKREKLRALLQPEDGSESDKSVGEDMEITFNTGLENLSKRILEEKDKKSDTVWEAVLRKRKEKKAARRRRSKYSSDDDSSDYDGREAPEQPDDFFLEEPSDTDTKISKKMSKDSPRGGKGKHERREPTPEPVQEQEASRAELELLLAGDGDAQKGPKGYKIKPKKIKGKKGKMKEIDEDKIPDTDIADDLRFSGLYTNPLFALDPTDPQFKRSATYARKMVQKQRKGDGKNGEEFMNVPEEPHRLSDDTELRAGDPQLLSEKEKFELSSTIRSLKRNVGKLSK